MKEGKWNNSLEHPLVSIVVITYNSSKYVLETLESIKVQTYKNIELIISDDFSTDNTVEICNDWLEGKKKYFINSKIIQAVRNTGIPSNVNRGVNEAKGEWIKLIAGDDILLENCIHVNVNFVKNRENVNFVFSKPIYIDDYGNELFNDDLKKIDSNDPFYHLNAKDQFLHLLTKHHPINPPTLFYKKKIVDDFGGFDEKFKNDDFPLYLKVTKAGYKLYFNNIETIKYRIHDSSFSQKIKDGSAISEWNLKKLKYTIIPQIDIDLMIKNPLVVIDIYNKLFFYKVVMFFGNTNYIKNKFSFIRFLSPKLILEKIKPNKAT